MYDLWYNLFSGSNMFGSAMSYESTQILCRYLSMGFTVALFIGLCAAMVKLIKIIMNL